MFSRITCDPAILNGKPCINNTRISVEFVLELIAGGASYQDILASYSHLKRDDLEQAVRYAAN